MHVKVTSKDNGIFVNRIFRQCVLTLKMQCCMKCNYFTGEVLVNTLNVNNTANRHPICISFSVGLMIMTAQ